MVAAEKVELVKSVIEAENLSKTHIVIGKSTRHRSICEGVQNASDDRGQTGFLDILFHLLELLINEYYLQNSALIKQKNFCRISDHYLLVFRVHNIYHN